MPNIADMKWFKENFHAEVERAIEGTPFTLDLLVALACQETGDVWPILRGSRTDAGPHPRLCVGDTIDFKPTNKGRKAFPRNKATCWRSREATRCSPSRAGAGGHGTVYSGISRCANPNKFCRGFGMFQLDLQFFKDDPDYFLEKRYEKFERDAWQVPSAN